MEINDDYKRVETDIQGTMKYLNDDGSVIYHAPFEGSDVLAVRFKFDDSSEWSETPPEEYKQTLIRLEKTARIIAITEELAKLPNPDVDEHMRAED